MGFLLGYAFQGIYKKNEKIELYNKEKCFVGIAIHNTVLMMSLLNVIALLTSHISQYSNTMVSRRLNILNRLKF